MKHKLFVWLPALLLTMACPIFPAGRLQAQQGGAAPAPAPALDELTGPIALYPDPIVIHLLTAAQNYDTLKLFSGWQAKNSTLKGSELQDAAKKTGFSDALVALAPFPDVVKMMVDKPEWTKALGQAVTADKKAVGDSIQRLRLQAQSLGNLKTTPQQVVVVTNTVIEKTVEQRVVVVTNTIIQIQPANPQVIYVPTYPQTVYVYQAPPPSSTTVASAALVGFTVGVIVGANNSYYHHHYYNYDDYWEDREDFYEDRQQDYQQNKDQRQSEHQANQDERKANQDERQSGRQEGQGQGQRTSTTPAQSQQGQAGQSQRQATAPSTQPQGGASQPPRQSASPSAQPRSTGGTTASRSSGMSSGGSYQSGSATRSQSSRGSSSMSSGRGGGGRSGGGGRGR